MSRNLDTAPPLNLCSITPHARDAVRDASSQYGFLPIAVGVDRMSFRGGSQIYFAFFGSRLVSPRRLPARAEALFEPLEEGTYIELTLSPHGIARLGGSRVQAAYARHFAWLAATLNKGARGIIPVGQPRPAPGEASTPLS